MDVELFHSDRFTRIIYFPLVIIYIYFLSFQKPGINIELYFPRVCCSVYPLTGVREVEGGILCGYEAHD